MGHNRQDGEGGKQMSSHMLVLSGVLCLIIVKLIMRQCDNARSLLVV